MTGRSTRPPTACSATACSGLGHHSSVHDDSEGAIINASSATSGARAVTSVGLVRERRIELTGGTLAYSIAGEGPALLLIHGLGGSRRTWRHLIEGLSSEYTVIAPDLPGHGESDPPAGDYSLGAHACAMRDLLLALGHRRCTLVGHSLGGGIALQTTYQFPERVDRLILIGSGGLGDEVSLVLRAATLPGADAVVAALSMIPTVVTNGALAVLPKVIAGPDASLLAGALSGLRGRKRRTAFLRTARSVIDWRGQAVSARRQTNLLHGVPVLLAWGARDATIPPQHHRAFASRIPGAVTVEIAGAGHYPHETDGDRVLSHLQAFLANTTAFDHDEASWVDRLTNAPHRSPVGELVASP